MTDSTGGFLGRWARLKEARRAGRDTLSPAGPAGDPDSTGTMAEDDAGRTARTGTPDGGVAPDRVARDGMPRDGAAAEEAVPREPELLGMEDDFSVFMRPGVPDGLRNRALQHLWRLDPVFANLDGLVDHAEDFTDPATVLPDVGTLYRVGLGFPEEPGPRVAERPETEQPATPAAISAEAATPGTPEEPPAAPREATGSAPDGGEDPPPRAGRPLPAALHPEAVPRAPTPSRRPAMVFTFPAQPPDADGTGRESGPDGAGISALLPATQPATDES